MNALFLLVVLLLPAEYPARVVRVVDGDTVMVTVQVWPDLQAETSIRILGVDTPELRGKCNEEKKKAQETKAALEKLLPKNSTVRLRNLKPDKYAGRHDADVHLGDGRSVAEILIASGLARSYDGGRRMGWCK